MCDIAKASLEVNRVDDSAWFQLQNIKMIANKDRN